MRVAATAAAAVARAVPPQQQQRTHAEPTEKYATKMLRLLLLLSARVRRPHESIISTKLKFQLDCCGCCCGPNCAAVNGAGARSSDFRFHNAERVRVGERERKRANGIHTSHTHRSLSNWNGNNR